MKIPFPLLISSVAMLAAPIMLFAEAPLAVGSQYVIHDRVMEISGRAMTMRAAKGGLQVVKLPNALETAALRNHLANLRQSQPTLPEINFVLTEPAANLPETDANAFLPLSCKVHVTLQPEADVDAVAKAAGVSQVDKPDYAPGQFVFHCRDQGGALQLMEALRQMPAVKTANAMLGHFLQPMQAPNDPYYAFNASNAGYQWHLKNTGQRGGVAGIDLNVEPAWATVKGNGIVIGIVDDGMEIAHPDLAGNYLASASWDFVDSDSDPTGGEHGTSVAGIIAAVGNNAEGITGVAPEAKLAALRILGVGGTTNDELARALTYEKDVIHIKNNAWGYTQNFFNASPLLGAALSEGTTTGRGGLGTIYIWAAGNNRGQSDTNYSPLTSSIHVIPVSARLDNGQIASYATYGANVVVAGLSGDFLQSPFQMISTTDQIGSLGYNPAVVPQNPGARFSNTNYTNTFNGTSASAAGVSGIVALMLEANPGLGWRDVKEILMTSATPIYSYDALYNKAGIRVSHDGSGIANAAAAVNLARNWSNLKSQTTINKAQDTPVTTLPSNATVSTYFTIPSAIRVEHVTMNLDTNSSYLGMLSMALISPSGTISSLGGSGGSSIENYSPSTWTYSSVQHWGENGAGKWRLDIRNRFLATTLNSATLKIYGTTPTAADAKAPFLLRQPANTFAAEGGTACFNMEVIGQGPLSYQWKKNDVAISPGGNGPILLVNPVTTANAGSYTCTISNAFGSYSTNTATLGVVPAATGVALNEALDVDAVTQGFGTQSSLGWSKQLTGSHDGIDVLKSGAITHGGTSILQSCITGPATLKFWWKISSEENADFLKLAMDSTEIFSASGFVNWEEKTVNVPGGTHLLEWIYSKNDIYSVGADAGFLDTFSIVYSGYAGWERTYFLGPQRTTANTIGALDDPDKDGLPNVLEYALRLDPILSSQSGLPVILQTEAGLEFTYEVDDSRTDVRLVPEVSASLTAEWIPSPATEVAVTGTIHSMRLIIPIGSTNKFVRLRVEQL
jgi:subtilisin family serine protease